MKRSITEANEEVEVLKTSSKKQDYVEKLKDEDFSNAMPLKRFFRSRAHCNPLSHNDGFSYPLSPIEAKWELHYPDISDSERVVKFIDVGMGFGGLTVALAQLFPNKLVLGMEIRAKVCEYVR